MSKIVKFLSLYFAVKKRFRNITYIIINKLKESNIKYNLFIESYILVPICTTILFCIYLVYNVQNVKYQDICITATIIFSWYQIFYLPYKKNKQLPKLEYKNIPILGETLAYHIQFINNTESYIEINSISVEFKNEKRIYCSFILDKQYNYNNKKDFSNTNIKIYRNRQKKFIVFLNSIYTLYNHENAMFLLIELYILKRTDIKSIKINIHKGEIQWS
jgi:hypothetical protein